MTDTTPHSLERTGFTALLVLVLAPVIAQGLWLPLEHVLGAAGTARQVTGAALGVGLICALAERFGGSRTRWAGSLVGGLVAVGLSLALALGPAGLGTLLAVAAASAGLTRWVPARLPEALDGLMRRRPGITAIYLLFALLTVNGVARVSVFIGDPTEVDLQALPGDRFIEVHSCLTAYVRAVELVHQGVDNVYADHWWYGALGLPPRPPGTPDPYAPFHLDNLSYPPPFLLLAEPLTPLHGDFLAQRALWFGLNGVIAAIGLWLVARWIDGPATHRVLLLTPILFGSVLSLLLLQVGNFHLASTVLTVLAMVAFQRRRDVQGGALLALMTLSKISPGLMGVLLLVQRRAAAVLYTAAFGVLLLVLSTLVYGTNPLESFVTYALPRLSSGEAFPHMDTENGLTVNLSPFGIPFKLGLFNIDIGDPWELGPKFARVYTVFLMGLAIAVARRGGDWRDQAIRWMALLVLAAFQSPFCPAYGLFALCWATSLMAVEVRKTWHALGLVAIWFATMFVPAGLDVRELAALCMAHTAVTLAVCSWLALRAPTDHGARASGT